jgi:parallel beta-helix repeat protein
MVVNIRKCMATIVTIFTLLNIFIILHIETCNASGNTIYVDDDGGADYTKIQEAINAANESDTVYVYGGTYTENLIISKTINLTGAGVGRVTINGNGDHTIKVNIKSVKISDFTIKNTHGTYGCILLNSVSDCLIRKNVVKNGGNGVYLVNSNNNTVEDNTIENNNVGIYLSNSDSNNIKGNNIQKNVMNGVFIASTSSNNTIYLNDFSDNDDENARDHGSNNWDYSSQGNYWDDYNDYDNNSNGIGDNPYIIEGGGGNNDNYPLGDFLSVNTQPVAFIDSISPNPATHDDTINFKGHGSDDGSIVAWEWKSDGTIISNSEDFSTSSLSSGTHTISFRVQDDDDNWSPSVERMLVIKSPNQIPIAYILEPGAPITKYYGQIIEFLGIWSDDGEIVAYSWRSDIDDVLSESIQFIKNNLSFGQHTIYFKVRDDHGVWSSEDSIDVTIIANPSNNPPVADVGGPYTGYANQKITFNGSNSYDPDMEDTITSYHWDFGDGSTGEGVSPKHTYTSEGNYTVNLTVTDSNGAQSKSTTYVNISIAANGQNGDGKDGEIPGFETIFIIMAIAFILIYTLKKRK